MASKLKDELLKELKKAYKFEESPTKRSIISSLHDKVVELNDDKDIHNFLWANKDLPIRMFTNDDFKIMPKVAGIWNGNANTSVIDLDKDFDKNWYNDYENIPLSKIQFVADKYGRDPKQMISYMGEEATKRRRHDITHDGSPSGYVAQMVAPRSVEAIERGKSPSTGDVFGDASQTLLYATPWGRGSQALVKNSPRLYRILSNPVVQGTISNTTAPLLTEVYDSNVYDADNPRGSFDWTDVGSGTATNIVGSSIMRGAGAGVQRILPKVGSKLQELGLGKSTKEATDEIANKYKNFKLEDATNPNVPSDIRTTAQAMEQLSVTNPALYELVAGRNAKLWQIAEQPGKNIEDKIKSYLKKESNSKYSALTSDGDIIGSSSKEELEELIKKFNNTNPNDNYFVAQVDDVNTPANIMKAYDEMGLGNTEIGYNGVKPQSQLISEESLKNYLTNQLADARFQQGKAITRFPIVGPYAQQYLDKKAQEEAEQKELDDITRRWNIRLGVK